MEHVKTILIEFIQTMIQDMKRRSFDEQGEQREETEQRIEQLKNLLEELRGES